MSDTDKLVAELRDYREEHLVSSGDHVYTKVEICDQAADAIERLEARAEKLEAALTQAQRIATENADLFFKANATIKHLTDALERRGEIIFGREGD